MAEDWRTNNFRSKVVAQIDDAIRQAASSMTRSSVEMEAQVYQKAKSREEYLALVARLILHVKDFNAKKDKKGQQQPGALASHPMGAANPPNMMGVPDPINALQNLARQGSTAPGQVQPQAGMMLGQQSQLMQRYPQQPRSQMMSQSLQQPLPQLQSQLQPLPPRPTLQRQDAFIVTSPQTVAPLPAQPVQVSAPSQVQQSVPMVQPAQQQPQPQMQSSAHSPAPTNSPITMLTAPSPQASVTPSPASRGQMGAPSPGTANLNTPGNPATGGGAPSPGGPRPTQEEQVYMEKLNKLSKYIEPLRRMVNKIEKEEEKKKDHAKMKSLLDILTNHTKRVPMSTLLRCEQVLENWDIPMKSTPGPGLTGSTTHMCQPLLDAVAFHMKNPLLNHILHRTFGPAMRAIRGGSNIRAPVPPPKRRKIEVENQNGLSDILKREVAHLGSRFKVSLDPRHHQKSKSVHLICRLEDKNLPSVPPITVTVPEKYPNCSPEVDTLSIEGYDACPFFQRVQKNFLNSLLEMPNLFALSSLLDTWEVAVRRACCPYN